MHLWTWKQPKQNVRSEAHSTWRSIGKLQWFTMNGDSRMHLVLLLLILMAIRTSALHFNLTWDEKWNQLAQYDIDSWCRVSANITQLQESLLAKLEGNKTECSPGGSEIYNLYRVIVKDGNRTIYELVLIKQETLDSLRFLPFDVHEFDSFLHQDTMNRFYTHLREKLLDVELDIKFQNSCFQTYLTDNMTHSGQFPRLRAGLTHSAVEIFAGLLTLAQLKHLNGFEICSESITHFLDAPVKFDICCSGKHHSSYDSVRTVCHWPDRSRRILCHVVTCVGFMVALFIPLIVKWIPASPGGTEK